MVRAGVCKEEPPLKYFMWEISKPNSQGMAQLKPIDSHIPKISQLDIYMLCHNTNTFSIFVDHINVMNGHIFDKAAKEAQVIDFHEIMLRFTMDTFVE